MPATDNEAEQEAGLTSGFKINAPRAEHIAAVFKGVAAMTREFEKCPRGSKVTERLMYGAMACVVIVVVAVALIRFGH